LDALPISDEQHRAAIRLAITRSYTAAAEEAGVPRAEVIAWTDDDAFIRAVGLCLVGLSDNHEP
jgi:hypothetical protein